MKRLSSLVIAVALLLSGCANQRGQELSSHEIVVPDESGPVAAFAGKELQRFLKQSLDADVKIVKAPSGKSSAIILGDNHYARAAGIEAKRLPRDGFVMKSVGDNVFIVGRDDMACAPEKLMAGGIWSQLYERGTLFGTYDFLERFLGVRFYFPGEIGTVVPKHESLRLPQIDIVSKPDYTVRRVSTYSGAMPEGCEEMHAMAFKNLNAYRLRMETAYIPFNHGLARLGYTRRFGESHPEYFALMSDGKRQTSSNFPHPGQLCHSSDIRDEVYKDAEAFLTGKTAQERGILTKREECCWDPSGFQPGYFCVMPQDGFYRCQCPACQKHFAAGPKESSEFIWGKSCDIADKLKANKIPGYLTMAVYPPYNIIPDRRIPDNVLISISAKGPWSVDKRTAYESDERKLRSWVEKTGRKVQLWSYANKYGKLDIPGIPMVTPKCVGKYYKLQRDLINGAFMESETDRYLFNYLNFYVFAKVCWDNSTDVEALLKEHYHLMFGDAAAEMETIYDRFESNWIAITGEPVETPLGPTSVPVSDYELWEKIYSEKELQDLEAQFAAATALTAGDAGSHKRVAFMRRNLLHPLQERREGYLKDKRELADLTIYAPLAPAPMKLDGHVGKEEWAGAERVFLRPFGMADGKAAVETTAMAMRDRDYLYVALECAEPSMDKLVSSPRSFDDRELWRDSSVELFLNPSGDRKKYHQILVNASGSLSDLSGEAGKGLDWNWNSGAIAAVARADNAWSVEIAIPLKSLGELDGKGFPVNFNRNRTISGEQASQYTWSPYLKHGFHELENFGSVRFTREDDRDLIKNGDFTQPTRGRSLGGWFAPKPEELQAGDSWELVSDSLVKGGKAMELRKTHAKGRVFLSQPLPGMEPDTDYLLTFFVKTARIVPEPGSTSGASVNINDGVNRWFPLNSYVGTIPWTKQGFRLRSAPSIDGKSHPYIRLCLRGASGSACFGDVRLRKLPPPAR